MTDFIPAINAPLTPGAGEEQARLAAAHAPEQVPLSKLLDCLEAITTAMSEQGCGVVQTCRWADVSKNTFAMWRALRRDPRIAKLAALASVVGYELLLMREGAEIRLTNDAAVLGALDAERRRRDLKILDMEIRFGVPSRTWSYWRAGVRPPSLRPLVILAEALGFDVVMRRRAERWPVRPN